MGFKRPLQQNRDEYQDRYGNVLQLCVAHELDDEATVSVQAVGVYQGHSLCREHLVEWNLFGIYQISSKNG